MASSIGTRPVEQRNVHRQHEEDKKEGSRIEGEDNNNNNNNISVIIIIMDNIIYYNLFLP